jgi:hypothetical protein
VADPETIICSKEHIMIDFDSRYGVGLAAID